MTDDTNGYDNDVAQKIADLTDEAVQSREDAVSYIRDHEVILALAALADGLDETKVRVSYDYDNDAVSYGCCVGFSVRSGGEPSVTYKVKSGTRTRSMGDCSDDRIADAVETVQSSAFQQAALAEAEELTEPARSATDSL